MRAELEKVNKFMQTAHLHIYTAQIFSLFLYINVQIHLSTKRIYYKLIFIIFIQCTNLIYYVCKVTDISKWLLYYS